MSISLLLADDHEVIRLGIRLLLNAEPDLQVVAEAATGVEVLAAMQVHRVDMILLDLNMPGGGGAGLIAELCSRYPRVRILVLSMYKDQTHVLTALRAGASGYVLKESQAEEVALAIRQVAEGRRYLSPELTEQVLDSFVNGRHPDPAMQVGRLTPRELEIIQLAAEGITSAEIAKRLFLSARTVETHRARAMHKLGLHNQVDLARYFVHLEMSRPSR